MADVAARPDRRGITIQRVGVKDVHLPVQVRRKEGGFVPVLGRVRLSVELPHRHRGTHMSRLLALLFRWSRQPIAAGDLITILEGARQDLQARTADVELAFKYFVEKQAPISHIPSPLDYDCRFAGRLHDGQYEFTLGVDVPVTCLCPCSKEISRYGAHNQRAVIRAAVRYQGKGILWLEDLISVVEQQGSAPIYPLLKRADEKAVTELAYENPKFVEDMLRDVVAALRADPRLTWYEVECESLESIHNHSVYAYQQDRRLPDGSWQPVSEG